MALESFEGWATRVTEAGEYDLTKVLEFVADCRSHWASQGKDWNGPWWRKVVGRKRGKGLQPRTMKHPRTGKTFVFPLFDVDRTNGQLVQATALEPTCVRCGEPMARRARMDGNGDIYGCSTHPACKSSHLAWAPVGGTGEAKVLPKPTLPPAPQTDEALLAKRIVKLVEKARRVVDDHGMTLPIGYRTTSHLAALTVIAGGDVDEAWRLWVDGRVSKQERDKFDGAGLPVGPPTQIRPVEEQPTWYGTVAAVLDAGLPVFLVGGAGTGKTRFARWYAERAEKELEVVCGSGDVAGRELWVARREAKAGETKTVLGPLTRACTNGDVMLLDEVDAFDSNALITLNPVLNGDRDLSVPVIGRVEVDPEVRVIAAANTNGRSKDRTYNARNRLDGAFLNRFAVVVQTRYEQVVDRKVALEALVDALEKAKA